MKERAVRLIATYLSKRPLGRIVRVKRLDDDEYLIAVEDVRDGRTHLMICPDDLETWLTSFKQGQCPPVEAALCDRCDEAHADRDADGELFRNCIACQVELVTVAIEEAA